MADVADGSHSHHDYKVDQERIEKLFKELDRNEDGKIDINELTEGLKRYGGSRYRPGQAQVSKHLLGYFQ